MRGRGESARGAVDNRHRGDSNPCGQSPMDFESISLTARTLFRGSAASRALVEAGRRIGVRATPTHHRSTRLARSARNAQ